MKPKPFWEDAYAEKDGIKTFGGGNPSPLVRKVAEEILKSGRAVEFGCGAGRDALFLASNGFEVTALDVSASGIKKLKEIAAEKELKINAEVKDMRDFSFKGEYDLFVAMGCLHLIPRNDQKEFFEKVKQHTRKNGINVFTVFTDEVPTPPDMEPFFVGLFEKGELFEIYKDWEIIEKNEYRFTDDHGNGLSHVHAGHNIIARKK